MKTIAMVLMATAKTILCDHIYSFNGRIYKQKFGGPIREDSATKSVIGSHVQIHEWIQAKINQIITT